MEKLAGQTYHKGTDEGEYESCDVDQRGHDAGRLEARLQLALRTNEEARSADLCQIQWDRLQFIPDHKRKVGDGKAHREGAATSDGTQKEEERNEHHDSANGHADNKSNDPLRKTKLSDS
jgi:hypothetical protein